MDKVEYVEHAPVYYALAITFSLVQARGVPKTQGDLDSILDQDRYQYFQKPVLFQKAVRLLVDAGVVEVVTDPFGPVLFRGIELADWAKNIAPASFPLFKKYTFVDAAWIRAAVRAVNEHYDALKVTPDDFEVRELAWEPIPLDRGDPSLQAATTAIDEVIAVTEADNGYPVHAATERDHVLAGLKVFSRALKEQAQISAMQIRTFALEPLARLIKRFGEAAVGVAASAARQAIFDWLKTNFGKILSLIT